MASLTGQSIANTYDSLLKLTDNEPLTSSLKTVTDGLGNSSLLQLSTVLVNLTGALSGTSATFSGNGAFGTTSGNLEVGYGATQGLYKLDVNGTGRFSGAGLFSGTSASFVGTGIYLDYDGVDQARITAGTSGGNSRNLLIRASSGSPLSTGVFLKYDGNVGIGTTSPGSNRLNIYDNSTTESTFYVKNDHATSGDNIATFRLQANTANTSSRFLTCSGNDIGGSGDALIIYGNGNVVNVNGSYGTISDIRLKENIVDANPKLQDLLQLKVRNFNFINDKNKLKQIGFIAQEFEEIFPGLIDISTDKDTNEPIKSIKTSILIPMLVKAIQELEARIKILEIK